MEKDDVLHLKNYTEILVDETLQKLWSELSDVCKCIRCEYDIKAIALNNLPPSYTVTEQGEIFTKVNNFRNQIQIDVIKEVLNAISTVSKNCSHMEKEKEVQVS